MATIKASCRLCSRRVDSWAMATNLINLFSYNRDEIVFTGDIDFMIKLDDHLHYTSYIN